MILTDKNFPLIVKENNKREDVDTAYFDYFNIIKIKIKSSFDNIEFLSLRNNNLQNLDFISYIPKLYYLDLRNNPVNN